IGQHFRDPERGYQVAAGLFRRGVLISGTLTNAQTIRIEPPLVIGYREIDEVLDRLEDTLNAVSSAPATGDVLTFPVLTPEVVATAPANNGNGHVAAANGHSAVSNGHASHSGHSAARRPVRRPAARGVTSAAAAIERPSKTVIA
ncbi:MAG: hypothetical protein ACRDHE_11840, partial [Ktedonobacterales bacterium]